MLYGDSVEWFEAVNNVEFGASHGGVRLLDNGEPVRLV